MDDTIDKIALCSDIFEPNCSDSDQPHSDDKITTKQDVISVKVNLIIKPRSHNLYKRLYLINGAYYDHVGMKHIHQVTHDLSV